MYCYKINHYLFSVHRIVFYYVPHYKSSPHFKIISHQTLKRDKTIHQEKQNQINPQHIQIMPIDR